MITDAALATLGGGLKRRETISGRLADALAWMYLASAAIKRFHDEGPRAADVPLAALVLRSRAVEHPAGP